MNNETAEVMFEVIDSSCTDVARVRTHEVRFNGEIKSVTFKYGEKTMLPKPLALKFNKDGFTVLDDAGDKYQPPVSVDALVSSKLQPGEVVARLEELTNPALYTRAIAMVGGEKLPKNAKKEELIEFLKASAAPAPVEAAPVDETVAAAVADNGDMPAAQLNQMFSN